MYPTYEYFLDSTTDYLKFLVDDYHFKVEKRKYHYGVFITYVHDGLQIGLCYGVPEFEVMMSMQYKKTKISWGYLQKLQIYSDFDSCYKRSIEEYNKVDVALEWYSVFLLRNVSYILQNKRCLSLESRKYDLEQQKKYDEKERLQRVRTLADGEWKNKNLTMVISLYMSIENQLTKLEKARLEYARKKLDSRSLKMKFWRLQ